MTSDPLADSRDKVVEVSGFVAINIVRVSSREVGEVGGEVGVDGEPEEEGDDCQGGPCGVDGLVSGRSSEHVIVRSLQMTAFSHGCIMESAKVHSNLVLQVKESGSEGGRRRGWQDSRPFPEFSSDAWGRSRGVERFAGVCGGHGGWGQAGGEGTERDGRKKGRKEGRKEGRGQCNNLSDTRHASNAPAAARHSGCLTLVFASLVPRSSRRDKTWAPSCVRPR